MSQTNTQVLVSVIMPVYNVASFLEEAIQSVLEQSLRHLEIILVNDGSTDESAVICKRFEKKYAPILFIDQENKGVSIARNNGLQYAKGEYVFFMDSDDTIDKNFLQSSYSIAKSGDHDIVMIGSYFLRRLPHVSSLPTCAQMIRLDFLRQHPDVRFPPHIQPCEDGLFSHKLLALTAKMGINPEGVYHYRQHENQNHIVIEKNAEKVLMQIPEWFGILEKFYQKHKLFESHAKHLALFVVHEPFELRYLAMPLNDDQKIFLHRLILDFMAKNVLPFLKKSEKKSLSKAFLYFLNAKDTADFDRFYAKYLQQRAVKKRFYMWLSKLVFINAVKQRIRKRLRENF